MWILSFLPDFVFHLAVVLGVVGILLSQFFTFMPFVAQYKLPVKVVSILLLVFGVYFEGAISSEKAWQYKLAEAEKKILEMQVKSSEANTALAEKIAENEKLRKDRKNETSKVIVENVVKYDSQCKLSNAFVQLHNSASQDSVPPSTNEVAGGTSDVKASEVLSIVTENYSTCYDIRNRLLSWQEWYKNQRKIYEGN